MIKKLVLTTGLAVCAAASTSAFADKPDFARCGGVESLGQDLSVIDPFYYNGGNEDGTTDSGIPHLPAYYGQMQTNNTYRFFNVNEMVATMIGEGKHGMWRYQDNGTVREYLVAGADGLPASTTDVFTNKHGTQNIIKNEYTHHDPEASWSGYRSDNYAPAHDLAGGETIDQLTGITDNNTSDLSDDYRVWVDLPINHPKYKGAYDEHAPIDLAGYYCTMSGPEYANARAAIRFAFGQEGANEVGPIGQRAGLDIKENYLNVLRLELFEDARAWVNVSDGTGNPDGTGGNKDLVNYQAVNADETPFELYLVERPFFNEEYLFYVIVFGDDSSSYIRPDGAYYDHLVSRGLPGGDIATDAFSTTLNHSPDFVLEDEASTIVNPTPVNLFGTHHPGGEGMTITNGACPAMGGDYGAKHYGAAWPNNYQEVTPLCDAVMVDIKATANLDGATWNDPGKYLANATVGGEQNAGDRDGDGEATIRGYLDNAGAYGTFTDPYLLGSDLEDPADDDVNPEAFTAIGTQSKTFVEVQEAVTPNDSLVFPTP